MWGKLWVHEAGAKGRAGSAGAPTVRQSPWIYLTRPASNAGEAAWPRVPSGWARGREAVRVHGARVQTGRGNKQKGPTGV
jgi:hypothetical protein